MTNPEAVEQLLIQLKNYTNRITVIEADSGGYNRFSMDQVFDRTGIRECAKRLGVRIVNLSSAQPKSIQVRTALRRLSVPLPAFLLDETDWFFTMPVPKIHMNTLVSIGIKNQWGVIQNPEDRLKLHPYFKHVIHAVQRALPPAFSVVDGTFGLTRTGPLRGDAVPLDWVLISDDIYRGDFAVCQLMGIDPARVSYLHHIFKKEGVTGLEDVEIKGDMDRFRSTKFFLKRHWTDYPGLLTFKSRLLAYVGYESVLAKPLHKLLYIFREPFF